MQVTLEAIRFNHQANSATNDAFGIRYNETSPVPSPEWVNGVSCNPQDSPAAYALNSIKHNGITIEAKFNSDKRTNDSNIFVQAIDGQRGNASTLGQVAATPITLVKGESGFVQLAVNSPRAAKDGIGVSDIVWRWQYSTNSRDWIDFATTKHRIYVVLGVPTCPWQPLSPDSENTQLPWTEVLEHACNWAAGITDLDEAATRITQRLNRFGDEGLLKYDNPNSGAVNFVYRKPFCFDCSSFLELLKTSSSIRGRAVNCDDCAAIVVSFANIVGCDLNEGEMGTLGFFPKSHLRIGNSTSQTGFFTHHTTAWTNQCTENDSVFDGCVKLDRAEDPSSPRWFVPTDIVFGTLWQHEYRFLLAKNPDECQASRNPRRRRIGVPKTTKATANEIISDLTNPFLSRFLLNREQILLWLPERFELIETTSARYFVESFWKHQIVDN